MTFPPALLDAAIPRVLAPPVPARRPAPERAPLPCRPLVAPPGRLERASLDRDLAAIPLPERSRALLAGDVVGLDEVGAAVVLEVHGHLAALVTTLGSGKADVVAYRPHVRALTGLGPGLTPTGDDLLVGLAAAARRLASGGLLAPRAASAYAESLAGLPAGQTTSVAHDLLLRASAGLFPAVLAAVVEGLGRGDGDFDLLVERVRQLVTTGAHSGADLLAGAFALVRGVVDAPEAW